MTTIAVDAGAEAPGTAFLRVPPLHRPRFPPTQSEKT